MQQSVLEIWVLKSSSVWLESKLHMTLMKHEREKVTHVTCDLHATATFRIAKTISAISVTSVTIQRKSPYTATMSANKYANLPDIVRIFSSSFCSEIDLQELTGYRTRYISNRGRISFLKSECE